MGITGLNNILKKYKKNKEDEKEGINYKFSLYIKQLSGTNLGIDIFSWIFTYLHTVNKNLCYNRISLIDENIKEEELIKGICNQWMLFSNKFLINGVKLISVWDGDNKPKKLETQQKRYEEKKKRFTEIKRIEDILKNKNPLERDSELTDKYIKLCSNTPNFSKNSIIKIRKFIESSGIKCIIAEDEAEKYLASMAVKGLISSVWSKDTDTIVLETPLILNGKLDYCYKEQGWKIESSWTESIIYGLGLKDRKQFREWCVLSMKTDFSKNLVGPKKGLDLIKKHGSLDAIEKEKIVKGLEDFDYKEICDLLSPNNEINIKLNDLKLIKPKNIEEISNIIDIEFDNNFKNLYEIYCNNINNIVSRTF